MALPKSLESVLLKTIIEARYEGVFAALASVRSGGSFVDVFDENAPGTFYRFDGSPVRHAFKGQAFLPQMVYLDAQRRPIVSEREEPMSEEYFTDAVRRALTQDNMTIITHSDVISGRRIPNERFEEIAVRIIENRRNAHRKIERLPERYPEYPTMDDITKSYMPPVGTPPGGIGTKATLTSALAVGAWKMRSFVDLYKGTLSMGNGEDPRFPSFYAMMRESQQPVLSDQGVTLAQPAIVVAHASAYMPDAVGGLTRILGFRGTKLQPNRFGEFESFSFQRATQQVLRTVGSASVDDEEVWAYYVPRHGGHRVPIIGVHRRYAPTVIGKRSRADSYTLVRPEELGFEPEAFRERTAHKLGLGYVAPVT